MALAADFGPDQEVVAHGFARSKGDENAGHGLAGKEGPVLIVDVCGCSGGLTGRTGLLIP